MGTSGAARLAGLGTSVFSEMSRLAAQHGAVNLGQGFPDFAGPDFVKAAARAAIDADLNQYAISHGSPRLRNAIAATWARDYGREVDPEGEVTVTSGATEAIADAMLAFLDPGDEVVLFEPFYDSYPPAITFAGGVPRVVTLRPPDWSFDPEELAAATKAASGEQGAGNSAREVLTPEEQERRQAVWWYLLAGALLLLAAETVVGNRLSRVGARWST